MIVDASKSSTVILSTFPFFKESLAVVQERLHIDFLSSENCQLSLFFVSGEHVRQKGGAAAIVSLVIGHDCTVVAWTNQGCKLQMTVS